MQRALIFLVKTLADLYLLTFLLRFVLQWIRASYYNPLSQFVLRVTAPLVIPARRVVPSVAGFDVPTLVVLTLLEALVTWLLLKLAGVTAPLGTFALLTLLRLVALTLWLYSVALFVYAILSWFGDRGRNPLATVLAEIVEPLLSPVRRLLPAVGGLDFSALLVMLLCQAALIALPLPDLLR
jgi:YggT family protein